ncbi:TRAP transporter large permease subunit, partial [Sinorhizobium fredii]
MTIVMIIVFCVLMMMAVPVGYALIISAGVAVLFNGYLPLSIVAQQIYDQTQSFPMLALPFFMLAGTLMLGGELGRQLLELASHAMQRWRGGPLSTTVVSSVVFGGVSGSAVANASALGSVLIPWQKKHGFPPALCAANNATSAVIDVLIPPSIPMILFSLVSGVSVANLFVAGILPGILMAASFVFVCWFVSVRRGYATQPSQTSRR